jgi:hypothetical protein
MPIDPDQLKRLVETELEGLTDPRVLSYVRGLLVEPRMEMRDWDYGEPGQQYPCWIVLDGTANSEFGIAYSEFGFGPDMPWGLLLMGETPREERSMGMDSGWSFRFLDAFFGSFASKPLQIWRVFKGIPEDDWEPITDEGDWEAAWAKTFSLREGDPQTRYSVWHSIAY